MFTNVIHAFFQSDLGLVLSDACIAGAFGEIMVNGFDL